MTITATPANTTEVEDRTAMPLGAITHVALTVSDLAVSVPWYRAVIGADPVLDEDEEGGEFHHVVYALDGGLLFGLHTHMGREAKDRADERRTGLDHISFGLSGTSELEKWRDRLDELGIQHGGIKKAHYGSGVSFRDPDNIALEFFIAPGT